ISPTLCLFAPMYFVGVGLITTKSDLTLELRHFCSQLATIYLQLIWCCRLFNWSIYAWCPIKLFPNTHIARCILEVAPPFIGRLRPIILVPSNKIGGRVAKSIDYNSTS